MSKTSFVIIVTSPLEKSYSACNFANAIIETGNLLDSVFFFQQGTTCTNAAIDLPNDEVNIQQQWSNLAQQSVELISCSASALRRGVNETSLIPGVKFGSIGQLLLSCNKADKVIQL